MGLFSSIAAPFRAVTAAVTSVTRVVKTVASKIVATSVKVATSVVNKVIVPIAVSAIKATIDVVVIPMSFVAPNFAAGVKKALLSLTHLCVTIIKAALAAVSYATALVIGNKQMKEDAGIALVDAMAGMMHAFQSLSSIVKLVLMVAIAILTFPVSLVACLWIAGAVLVGVALMMSAGRRVAAAPPDKQLALVDSLYKQGLLDPEMATRYAAYLAQKAQDAQKGNVTPDMVLDVPMQPVTTTPMPLDAPNMQLRADGTGYLTIPSNDTVKAYYDQQVAHYSQPVVIAETTQPPVSSPIEVLPSAKVAEIVSNATATRSDFVPGLPLTFMGA